MAKILIEKQLKGLLSICSYCKRIRGNGKQWEQLEHYIAKHSEANRVEIRLEQRDSILTASIKDNGKGFDLEKVLRPDSLERGFGIIGMKERVSLLGGKIDIQSRPDSGTYIYIEISCPKRNGANEEDPGSHR